MTLKIDKAGRVVLPKPVRDRFGLRAGSSLQVQETPEGVVLKPISKRPSLVRAGRFLVHTGKLPKGFDVLQAIEQDREARLQKLAGP